MTDAVLLALAMVLGAEIEVPPGAPLAPAISAARPGDVVRLGPGVHRGTLGRAAGLRVVGAGAGASVIEAPEGEDGAVATGSLELTGVSLRTGPQRCALKVLGGEARLEDVALAGGACGAYIEGGRLSGRSVVLAGGYGLLAHHGEVLLEESSARGTSAGVAILGGKVALRRSAVTGPSREAGISVAGGEAHLDAVVVRSPGPAGIAVSAGARVEGVEVTIAGVVDERGMLGDCIQATGGTLQLRGATLVQCRGAALESSRSTIQLDGVDAAGGTAGCLVLVNGTAAELSGNLCAGRGPGLVVASRSRGRLVANRWWTDPVLWADCGAGIHVEVGRGERLKTPCGAAP